MGDKYAFACHRILIFLILFACAGIDSRAQVDDHLLSISWEEAADRARADEKLIFVYAYKSGTPCQTCGSMERYVFSQQAFDDYFSDRIIPLRMDLSGGKLYWFVYKYGIERYPTYLYLTWDGTLVDRQNGYRNIDQMIGDARNASRPETVRAAMDRAFREGERSADFLYHYIRLRSDAGEDGLMPLVDQYLDTQRDWLTERNIDLIFRYAGDIDSPLFRFLASHKEAFSEVVGKDQVDSKVSAGASKALNRPGLSIDRRDTIYAIAYPDKAEELSLAYRMYYYDDRGLEGLYARTAIRYYEKYPPARRDRIYNDLDRMLAELYDDQSLKLLLGWSRELADGKKNAANLLRIARIEQRLDRGERAKDTAKQALKLARKEGEGIEEKVKAFLISL